MKHLLVAALVVLSSPLFAAECVVVSGDKKDDNGAFSKRKILKPETSIVAGKKCKVVGGLKELKTFMAQGKIKIGSDLLIVLGAHGGKDEKGNVTFDFNTDEPTADEIHKYLQTLSKDYQVGAVLHACQSGEVMNRIIQNESDPSAGKLCLVTSSSRGRMSYSNEKDLMNLVEKVKPGKTLEDIFLQTPSGMISSAAWEEVGVPQYLRAKTVGEKLNQGMEIMRDMDQLLRSPTSCTTPGEINSALCISPAVSDELYQDLSHFMDPHIPGTKKRDLLATYTISAQLFRDSDPNSAGAKCYDAILSAYRKKFGPDLENLQYWSQLDNFLEHLKNPNCEAQRILDKQEAVSIYSGPLHEGLVGYQKSLESLKRKYTKTKWDENFDLSKFAQASAGDKQVCKPQSKQQIIQSLMGESFFEEEMDGDNPGEMQTDPSIDVSTQHVMKAFQNASIQKKDMPNVKDAKRRDACRKFKF